MPDDDIDHSASRPRAPGSDELLHLVLESATDYAIFSLDTQGLVTSWNTGAERVLGYRTIDMIGQTADVLFIPEERENGAAEMERALAATNGRAEDERWQLRADGTRFWASGLMLPLRNPDLGFVKILRDRTEAHLVNQRLRENEERFRVLATNIPQLVFRCRADGSRIWGSPQWIEYTGLSLDESVGHGWLNAIHPNDREHTLEAWRQAQSGGEYYVEHRIRRSSDGEYRWHQTRARPIGSANNESVEVGAADWVGTMSDVHDMRRLQDQQVVLLAELQHRTRNLLAVVQSIATQTARKAGSLREFEVEFSARLQALSRVQALAARHHRPEVNLRELVDLELKAHGDGEIQTHRVKVEGEDLMLPAETAMVLGLGLHELATNALKYGALAQEQARLQVRWLVEEGEGRIILALDWRETGVRLPPDSSGPRRKGYGTELIERALPYQLGADTDLKFTDDGVFCRITVPLDTGEYDYESGN